MRLARPAAPASLLLGEVFLLLAGHASSLAACQACPALPLLTTCVCMYFPFVHRLSLPKTASPSRAGAACGWWPALTQRLPQSGSSVHIKDGRGRGGGGRVARAGVTAVARFHVLALSGLAPSPRLLVHSLLMPPGGRLLAHLAAQSGCHLPETAR